MSTFKIQTLPQQSGMERGIRSEHQAIFRCPITHRALSQLSPDEVPSVNQDIVKGNLFQADGSRVAAILQQEALGTGDRRYIYRLEDGISWLLPALAMVYAQDGSNQAGKDASHTGVRMVPRAPRRASKDMMLCTVRAQSPTTTKLSSSTKPRIA